MKWHIKHHSLELKCASFCYFTGVFPVPLSWRHEPHVTILGCCRQTAHWPLCKFSYSQDRELICYVVNGTAWHGVDTWGDFQATTVLCFYFYGVQRSFWLLYKAKSFVEDNELIGQIRCACTSIPKANPSSLPSDNFVDTIFPGCMTLAVWAVFVELQRKRHQG